MGRVEIDESHIMRTNGQAVWLFGIICLRSGDVRLKVVGNDRSREALLPIIEMYVDAGFVDGEYNYRVRVYSDGWGAYSKEHLEAMGYLHRKIIHA